MSTINFLCPKCNKVNRLPVKSVYTKANCGYCGSSLLQANPIEADENNFNTILQNVTVPVIVDFWAPWCGPCRMMAPNFEQASKELSPKAQFVKVNTEQNQQLSSRFNIQSIPTLIIFKNGKEIHRTSGALSTQQIKSLASQF